jgi:NADH-quinone oxidoreductase subunit J
VCPAPAVVRHGTDFVVAAPHRPLSRAVRTNMLGLPASSGSGATHAILPFLPVAQSAPVIPPALIFVLAAVGAIGLMLLLPGRMEAPLRRIGGVILLAAGLVFGAVVARTAAGGMGVYFWIFAAIAVLGAARVITHPKPVYSALYFVLTVMASAGLFVLMWAEFMAAALVLIYAGAILVTYVFVIMLAAEATQTTGPGGAMHEQLAEHDAISREPILASAIGFALLGIVLFVVFDHAEPISTARAADVTTAAAVQPAPFEAKSPRGFVPVGGTQQLGNYLFNKQLINLELAGLILTVAMVGAIVIARKRVVMPVTDVARATGDVVIGPATPVDDNPHSIPVYGTDNPRQKEYPET